MASIREAAQNVLDIAKDGIGWIAFWKEGRGWESDYFWPDYDEDTSSFRFDDEDDVEALRAICEKDSEAILVNSWVHNLGVWEGKVSRDKLAENLRWQYNLHNSLVREAITN